ncbi:hypothetical protein ACFOYU_04370 [Microvirga sp. GCM10011540]|uniref:hypothetical protein n=1 Tax=Microvirga sp. GCM10011540 TaxID=3317338 RepID=UPI00360EE068
MTHWRKILQFSALVLPVYVLGPETAAAQQAEGLSCTGTMTQQLRRFSEKCLSELVTFVASQPEMAATVYSESEKYYVTIIRTDEGVLAEAVSKFNYPLMKAEAPEILKQLGWTPPENESDDWSKRIGHERIRAGDAGKELSQALAAYGLKPGEAITLTIGPKLADKPTSG